MEWENELEQIIEQAELAEEAAMAELEQFGCIWFEDGAPTWDGGFTLATSDEDDAIIYEIAEVELPLVELY